MGEQEQFQQPDPLQKMYGVLSQKGYYTKSFDEFKQKYSQPENIDKLYSVLNRDGLYSKNKESFYGKYFPTLPEKPNGAPKPDPVAAPFLIGKNTFAIPEGGFKQTGESQAELLSHVKTSPKINYPDQQAPKESKDPVGDFMAEQNEKKRQSLSKATDNTTIARNLPQEPLAPVTSEVIKGVKENAFHNSEDAADWLSKNKKIEIDPTLLYQYDRATLHKAAGDNKTSQIAADKVYETGRLRQAIQTSPDIETVAAKYGAAIGEIKDPATVEAIQTGSTTWKGILDDATKGHLLNTLFHSSDFVNEVKKNPALFHQYQQESANLMQHYPEFGTGIVASIISQAREDKGKNNWFINVKSKEDTDKMVDELVGEGKLSLMDKTFYQQHRDDVFYKIKSPGIVEEGLGGVRDFADNAIKSYKAAESKGVGLVTGWMGQERNHDTELAAEDLSKRSQDAQFQPKGIHKYSMIGGQMVGYLLPMGTLAKGLTASQLISNPMVANGLMFGMEEFGNVEGRSREYFPNDKTKQFAYTSLLTLLNTSIGGVLPQGKAAEALSKIEPTAAEVLNKFTTGEISSAAAKDLLKTQIQKVLVDAGDIAGATIKHNVKAANVMSALEMADRGLVSLFDGQDPHEKTNATHAFESWATNFISSTALSGMAAVPEARQSRIKAKQIFEMAANYDKYNSILDRQVLLQPELAGEIKDKKQNLQIAAGILNDISNTELTQAQKEKYLLHSLNEQMLTKKLEGMTDGLLKKQTREQIKKSEEARVKLFEDRKEQLNEQQKAAIDKQFEEIQKPQENVTTDQPTGIPTAESGNKEIEPTGVGETNTGLQVDNGRSGTSVGDKSGVEVGGENEYTKKRSELSDKVIVDEALDFADKNTTDPLLKELIGGLKGKEHIKGLEVFLAKEGKDSDFQSHVKGKGNYYGGGIESIRDSRTIVHELLHHYTEDVLSSNYDNLEAHEKKFVDNVHRYFDIAKENANGNHHYGLTSVREFLSELTNPSFRSYLESIRHDNTSLLTRVKEVFTNFINSLTKKDSTHDFKISSDVKQNESGDYYVEVEGKNFKQNTYFDSKQEAEAFHRRYTGKYDHNNLYAATLLETMLHVKGVNEKYEKRQEAVGAEVKLEAPVESKVEEVPPASSEGANNNGSETSPVVSSGNEKSIFAGGSKTYKLGKQEWVKPGELGEGIEPYEKSDKLKEQIRQSGKVLPIEIEADGFIVDGEHRYRALMDLGVKDIPVFVGEQDGAAGRLKSPYKGISVDVEIPKKTNTEQVVQGSDTTQAPTENPKPVNISSKTPHADFREQILSDLANEKGSEFDFVLDELPLQQSGRKTAVKNIRQGKSTKATKMVEEAIQKMYDEGYVYLNRGRGNHVERQAIPLEHYMEEIRKPLEATEADLHELNTLLGEEAFNDAFDRAFEEITKTQNNETKRNGEVTQTPVTPEGAAGTSPLETKAGKSSTQPDTENTIRDRQGAEPPTNQEQAEAVGGGEMAGIRHADNAERRKEQGIGEYEKHPQTEEQWSIEADRRISENPNIANEIIAHIEKERSLPSDIPFEISNTILKKHMATLDAAIETNATPELLKQRSRAIKAQDLSNTSLGRGLKSIQGYERETTSFGEYLTKEADSHGVETLPEETIAEMKSRYDKEQDLKKKIDEAYEKGKQDQLNELAEKAVRDAAKSKTRKSKEAIAKEKEDLVKAIKDKWKKAANDGTLTAVPLPYAKQLAAVAPDVMKLMKVYLDDGVSRAGELIDRIHENLKDEIPELTKRDVGDILLGLHTPKKETRSDLAAKYRDMKTQLTLLNKIEDRLAGVEDAKTPIEKIRRSKEVEDLQAELERIEMRMKEETPQEEKEKQPLTEEQRLSNKKKRLQAKIAEIGERIKSGDYSVEEAPRKPIKLDREAQDLEDQYIEMQRQDNLRRAKAEYDRMGKGNRRWDRIWQTLGLKRMIQTGIDFSMPFRQAVVVTMNPLKAKTTLQAFGDMFGSVNVTYFKRYMHKLEQNETGKLFREFKGTFSEPDEFRLDKREEEFRTNIVHKLMHKAPIVEKIWFSERAAAAYLNTIRLSEFKRAVDGLKREGATPENAPHLYEDAVKWIMNITGRGNLLKMLEESTTGRRIAGNTYYGARLMASRINMLNPYYYATMPKEIRVQAMRDWAGFTGGLILTGLAGVAAGGTISFNPDDPDFLQLRFGKKVYDISGGLAGYVRTYARLLKTAHKVTRAAVHPSDFNKNVAGQYSKFAVTSAFKQFGTNKLAPNTSYAYHFFTNSDGRGGSFNPYEIVQMYPMYADDMAAGLKDEGLMAVTTVLAPNIFGVGYQAYKTEPKDRDTVASSSKKQKPSKPTRKHKTRE